ncbi:aspartyl protease family protein At5g10770-like [Macadamia integrifolia]|uniref:aspartyl protease family protein At5g10770-like n=1 Tax=Macadamia integrifolia TaxID=60698 RepID=UPI001C4F3F04|nr:aspartyl protease family protein At5g10770-like [Macadamia integrifolia]
MANTFMGRREKARSMATTNPFLSLGVLFSTLLILSLLFCSENASAYEGGVRGETMESDPHQQHSHVIKISDLLPAPVCSTSTSTSTHEGNNNAQTMLKVVHKHGPCSKHSSKQKAKLPTPTQILLEDQSRVEMIQSRFANQVHGSKATTPTHSGRSLGTGNYIVTVGIGSPKRDFSLIFDTGSDLTWIQCEPCVAHCYKQQEPIFNPSKSSSYSNITCNAKECSSLKSATGNSPGCTSSTCVYGIQYGDQSYSVGYFGRETLTLTSSDVFNKFMFGCGQRNDGLFGYTAGLLGLGRNKISLISQTYQKYGGLFSYCLPSTSSSTGYLAFGYQGKISSNVKFTPLLVNTADPSFYFLDLIAISVGGKKLPISASVFATSGTIIDSGTVITRLPPTAYSTLRSSFRKLMSSYPMVSPISILDTCYNFTGYKTVKIPKIALYFRGGIPMDIDSSGVFFVRNIAQVCLAFAGNSDAGDIAILGNKQQQRLDVIYDVAKKRIGFGLGGCS